MRRRLPALGAALALVGPACAQSYADNAGHGGIYLDVDLRSRTGNDGHLGCADVGGLTFVSARDPLRLGNHVLYAFDGSGALLSTMPQPAIHATSPWGMRDLCTDGQNIAGGSEAGISIVTPQGTLATTWNGVPISQPITGPMLAALGVPRGLAWDGAAAGGQGRFYAVNFDSAIYEFDVLGNITAVFSNRGWSGTGLAFDHATGNLWIDSCPAGGDIAELARSAAMAPTGRRVARARPDALGGGLSEATCTAGVHASWSCTFALANIGQQAGDRLTVQRVDLIAARRGSDELRLETAVDGNRLDTSAKHFGAGDTVTMQVTSPNGADTGRLCWTFCNFPPQSSVDDITDLSPLQLGLGIVPEARVTSELSLLYPAPTTMLMATLAGSPLSTTVAAGTVFPPGFLVRAQTVSFDPLSPHVIAATNEVHLLGDSSQTGIVVDAVGRNSAAALARRGFWRIAHQGGHAAIRSVRLDWNATAEPGQETMVFDIDQSVDGRRLDAGNGGGTCAASWRLGSDLATGLDYAAVGNLPSSCAPLPSTSGFRVDIGDAGSARAITFRFAGGLFTAGKALEFDCDTDGGLGVDGAAMRGLVITVEFTDNTQATGVLAVDAALPARAVVRL